jgi:hypothetical protein
VGPKIVTQATLPNPADPLESALVTINSALGESPYRLAMADPKEIRLLKKNARFMTREQFRSLVQNISRDKALASVPLCVRERDGGLLVLSGNHRVKAAREAGVSRILILVIEEGITRDRSMAIQLSHNAIAGQDDVALLRELWDSISDLSEKVYTGLDDKSLEALEAIGGSNLNPVRLDFKQVTFLMLPEEAAAMEAVFKDAYNAVRDSHEVYVVQAKNFERFVAALAHARKVADVKNAAVALNVILNVYEDAKAEAEAAESKKREQGNANDPGA